MSAVFNRVVLTMKDLRASKILKSDNHLSNFERFCKNYSGTEVKNTIRPEYLQS